jgi:hypothetical protein
VVTSGIETDIGNRNCDHPVYSIVSVLATLPRAPITRKLFTIIVINNYLKKSEVVWESCIGLSTAGMQNCRHWYERKPGQAPMSKELQNVFQGCQQHQKGITESKTLCKVM